LLSLEKATKGLHKQYVVRYKCIVKETKRKNEVNKHLILIQLSIDINIVLHVHVLVIYRKTIFSYMIYILEKATKGFDWSV
jgi:hypothetical protein